jgi:hypothetical protein
MSIPTSSVARTLAAAVALYALYVLAVIRWAHV